MNVIISNKYRQQLNSLEIDVSKKLEGEYEVDEIISTFKNFFFKTKSDFLKAQERDRIKISYALSHNIDMYIYPYFDMPQTTDDLFLEKYHAHSKFHNDTVWRLYQMG